MISSPLKRGNSKRAGLARRARKYFLCLVTITQDVADFLGADHGRTVLTNAATKLLMKQDSATIEPVVTAFQLSTAERQFLLGAGKGEGLFFAHGTRVALTIEAGPAEHRLATTAPQELADRNPASRPGPTPPGERPAAPRRDKRARQRRVRPAETGGAS